MTALLRKIGGISGPLVLLAVLAAASSCGRASGETLYARLEGAVQSGSFYYAHQDDLCYGHGWKVEDVQGDSLLRSDVLSAGGDFPAIVGFDLGGIELGSAMNLDGVPFALMRRAAITHAMRGGMVSFSWHARNPLTGGDSWDVSSDMAVASVLEGGAKHWEFLGWLDRAAAFLSSLTLPDGRPVPIIFRPWHENVGSWFWWGGRLCTPEQYKALFTLTRNRLEAQGAGGMVWVYSPDSNASPEDYFARYPGDGFVDILGTDHYQSGPLPQSRDFYMSRLREVLGYTSAYAAEHGKLICLSETGYEGIPDPQWWTGTLLPALEGFPLCYLLCWRNAWDIPGHFYAPFKGSADAPDFAEFRHNHKTLFLSDR